MKEYRENKLVGLGFRPEYYHDLSKGYPLISWLELLTENYINATPNTLQHLQYLREHYSMSFHGVSLSIGGIHPLDWIYLEKIKKLSNLLKPHVISDHLSFSRFNKITSHDLLPIIYTDESLEYVAERVSKVQDFLGQRLYLENPSAYLSFSGSEMPEYEFFRLLCSKTGCGMILDVNNIYVNEKNLNYDSQTYFKSLKKNDLGYCHLAGHSIATKVRIDTHGSEVCDEVWDLFREVISYFGPLPSMIERDQNLPEFESIEKESLKIATVLEKKPINSEINISSISHGGSLEPPASRSHLSQKNSHKNSWNSLSQIFFEAVTLGDSSALERAQYLFDNYQPTPANIGLGVYSQGFQERLIGVLAQQIPTFTAVVGRTKLKNLLEYYIRENPPTSYCVDKSLANFSSYIKQNSHKEALTSLIQSDIPLDAFLELAQLEQTLYHQIFQEGEIEHPLPSQSLVEYLQSISLDELYSTEFKLINSIKLLSLSYDVASTVRSFQKTGMTVIPVKKPTCVAVFRRDGVTTTKKIPRWQYMFLSSLKAQTPFGQALSQNRSKDTSKIAKFLHCLGYWCQMGIFADTLSPNKSSTRASHQKNKGLFSPELAP